MLRTELVLVVAGLLAMLSMAAARTSSLMLYQSKTLSVTREQHELSRQLTALLQQFVEDGAFARAAELNPQGITVQELSSKVNLNYDNEIILNLPAVKAKIINLEEVYTARSEALQQDYSAFITEGSSGFFSVYTQLQPLTSPLKQLSLLMAAKTGQPLVPLAIQNAVGNGQLLTASQFFNALGNNEGLWALTSSYGRFNVNEMDSTLLTGIVNHPLFKLESASAKASSLLALRETQGVTQETLEDILGPLEEEQQLIYAYLGTQSFFYEVTVSGSRQQLTAIVLTPPPVPGGTERTALIVHKRYLKAYE